MEVLIAKTHPIRLLRIPPCLLLSLVFLLLQACQASPTESRLPPTFSSPPTRTPQPTHTPSPTNTPTPSATITPTPSPTIGLPLLAGTSMPFQPEPISPENASRMSLLAIWPVSGAAQELSWSPDGRWLVMILTDSITTYDRQSLEKVGRITLAEQPSTDLVFSPDGSMLAAGLQDNTLTVWKLPTGEALHKVKVINPDFSYRLLFTPDSSTLITSYRGMISLLRLADGNFITYQGRNASSQPEIAIPEGAIERLDIDSLFSAVLSPDGQTIAVNPGYGISLFQQVDGYLVHLDDLPIGDQIASFTPDGKNLIFDYSQDGRHSLKFVRFSDGSLVGGLEDLGDAIDQLSFSPDGQTLLVNSRLYPADSPSETLLQLWRVSDWQPVLRLEQVDYEISPDGAILATWASSASNIDDKTIDLWRTADGSPLVTIEAFYDGFSDVIFSLDSTYLAVIDHDEIAHILDLGGQEVSQLPGEILCPGNRNCQVAFSPPRGDQSYEPIVVTIGKDGSMNAWLATDGSLLKSIRESDLAVEQMALTADSADLGLFGYNKVGEGISYGASYSNRNIACSISVVGCEELENGISSCERGVYLFNLKDGQPAGILPIESGGEPSLYQLSADSQALAMISYDTGCSIQITSPQRPDQKWDIAPSISPRQSGFLVDGSAFWIGDDAGHIDFYNPKDGSQVRRIELNWMGNEIKGNWELSQDDFNLYMAKRFSGDKDEFKILALSSDGEYLVSLTQKNSTLNYTNRQGESRSGEKIARIDYWKIRSGAMVHTLGNPLSCEHCLAAVSPDGAFIAVKSDGMPIQLFNAADGSLVHQLGNPATPYTDLIFTPDGKILVAAADKWLDPQESWEPASLEFYDTTGGQLLNNLGFKDELDQIAISMDGSYVVTLTERGILQLWGVTP